MRTFRKLQCPSWSPSFGIFDWAGRDCTLAPVASRGAPPSRPLEIIRREYTTRGYHSTSKDTIRRPRRPFDTPKEKRVLQPSPQASKANWAEMYHPRASFDTPKEKRELQPPPQSSKANWAEMYHSKASSDTQGHHSPFEDNIRHSRAPSDTQKQHSTLEGTRDI